MVEGTFLSSKESDTNVSTICFINTSALLDRIRRTCVNEEIVRNVGYMLNSTFVSLKFINDLS